MEAPIQPAGAGWARTTLGTAKEANEINHFQVVFLGKLREDKKGGGFCQGELQQLLRGEDVLGWQLASSRY